jgi:hypothetical protein
LPPGFLLSQAVDITKRFLTFPKGILAVLCTRSSTLVRGVTHARESTKAPSAPSLQSAVLPPLSAFDVNREGPKSSLWDNGL